MKQSNEGKLSGWLFYNSVVAAGFLCQTKYAKKV
jgi:hypothetical protein